MAGHFCQVPASQRLDISKTRLLDFSLIKRRVLYEMSPMVVFSLRLKKIQHFLIFFHLFLEDSTGILGSEEPPKRDEEKKMEMLNPTMASMDQELSNLWYLIM